MVSQSNLADSTQDFGASSYAEDMAWYKAQSEPQVEQAIQLYLDTDVATAFLKSWLRDNNKTVTDLRREYNKPLPLGDPKKKTVALVQHMAGVTKIGDLLIVKPKEKTTDVWRLIERISTKTEELSHVYAVKWRRTKRGRGGDGILHVAFRTGGRVRGTAENPTSVPVYQYHPVSYDYYYELWKRMGSPGTSTYYYLGYNKSGHYIGNMSVGGIR